ncbi:hypothetical protein CspHIS471_0209330 [Cutaneotrichosporon sp. HIS471]|nr:hypothetical protein CspHIS471_0209330 [Cutaneotrichosporon sp. HIS471]
MPPSGKMAVAPQQEGIQPRVLGKLITFALLMAVVPIGMYFSSLNWLYDGNTTYAALTAVVAANIVLASYVYLAFAEDAAERTEVKEKKAQ